MRWRLRKSREQDIDRELRSHLDAEAEEQAEHGMPEDEAQYAAKRALGNVTRVKEEMRAVWGGRWIDDLLKDIRYAGRQMRSAPGFMLTVIASLALGIGASTAIFTLINAVLIKSLPVRDPAGLVVLGDARASGDGVGIPTGGLFSLYSYDLYKHLETKKVFTGLCAFRSSREDDISVRQNGQGESQVTQAKLVSGNYFEVLGIRAAMGRTLTSSDDSSSAPPTAVVSFRYWKNKLGSHPSVIGSSIELGGVSFTIVGVAPPGFYGETLQPNPPSFWLPLSADRQLNHQRALIDNPDEHWLYLMGRLAPGISKVQAEGRLTAALHNWLLNREGAGISTNERKKISKSYIELTPGGSGIVHMQQTYSWTLRLLLGISLAVLIITCANAASLVLARGTARATEISVRRALGASRGRLIRQWLTESLVLALSGGASGLLVAIAATRLLIALFFRGTDHIPIQTYPDFRVLLFALILSCGAAIAFGLAPAIRINSQIGPVLKGASPGIKGSRLSHRSFGLGSALIAGEVALSLVVLAAAGAFTRSLANLSNQRFGFDGDHVLTADIDTSHAGYDDSRLGQLYRRMYSRLNGLPGVKSASFSYYSPFDKCCWAFSVGVQGYSPKPMERMSVRLNRVSPGYFQTLGTKVLAGRTFDERDTPSAPRVAVVNEELVRRFFSNRDPIGRRFGIGGERNASELEIVGVVENAKYESPWEETTPMAFLPLLQVKPGESASADQSNFVNVIEIRSSSNPDAIASEIRSALAEIDPHLPVLRVSALSSQVSRELNRESTIAALALAFGSIALALSCLGLYGLMAYSVQRRTNEMGVRIALGARRVSITTMVVRQSLLQALAGIAVGIPAAFATIRFIASQLYGVDPADPQYLAIAALVPLLCSAAAGYIPARHAARIDPMVALRYE